MKSFNNLWNVLVSEDNIRKAVKAAARNKPSNPSVSHTRKQKTKQQEVRQWLVNIDATVQDIKAMLDNFAPPDVLVEDRSLAWRIRKHPSQHVIEHACGKMRTIRKPHFYPEQIIHHAVVQALMPVFMRGMYDLSCGSIPGRGPLYGKKKIEGWIRNDPRNVKYVAQLDIHHFYQSIDHDVLNAWLEKKIKDKRMLYLLGEIIDGCEEGLPLGFYTSQWLANFLLQPLDHFIKEELHVPHYLRYMDDMILTGPNKKELHKAVDAIEQFLADQLHLRLKGNKQVYRFIYTDRTGKARGRKIDTMGYLFARDKTTLRRRLMLKMTRKARRIAKKEKITAHDASAIISYMGWVSHSDTYNVYLNHIKPHINIQRCKRLVAAKNRKESKANERLEKDLRDANRRAADAGL